MNIRYRLEKWYRFSENIALYPPAGHFLFPDSLLCAHCPLDDCPNTWINAKQTHGCSIYANSSLFAPKEEVCSEYLVFHRRTDCLDTLKDSGEAIAPKARRIEAQKLAVGKDAGYLKMRAMRANIKVAETLCKTACWLAKEGQDLGRGHTRRKVW